jgi:predicted metal-dependent hydrolase
MLHSWRVQVESALLFETPEQIYARVFRQIKPRTPLPEIRVEYCQFANANSFIRSENNRISVRIADVLQGAPAPVVEALAHILLCKLFRRPIPRIYSHRYRLYLNRREMRRSLHLLRQIRGRKFLSGPQGEQYHLDEIFEELNVEHFNGLLARPALSWSRSPSRSILGHYDPSHNAIIISRLLDGPEVPLLALRYVVFHEMLHLRFPVDHKGARRRVHTREFREAEKAFAGLAQAKELIKKL